MDIIIRGSKLEITEAMESYAKEKISRLEKYLENSDDTHATILVKIHGHLHIVEVTIPLKNFILRAEESKDDFYAAIDTVTDKLERQIRKNKTRIAAKKNKEVKDFAYDYIQSIEEESEEKIVKRKKIEVKPMDEEEAILQMELLGHEFYLYKDIGEPAIIYKRKDGDYGIIEAE
jgi:putative sigma-54 modulation protein